MIVKSEILVFPMPSAINPLTAVLQRLDSLRGDGTAVLRWGLIEVKNGQAIMEVARLSGSEAAPQVPPNTFPSDRYKSGVHVAFIVPTGVGASVGGFIGDAGPAVKALEVLVDTVVVHPNVVNGADFYGGGTRSLYVDGYTLDEFLADRVRIARAANPRVGLLLDRLGPSLESKLLNAANGMTAVLGVNVVGYTVCDEKLQTRVSRSDYGHFIGEVTNAEVLLAGATKLQMTGADCIAVVSDIQGPDTEDWLAHYTESEPNPIGSIEALISRAITWQTGLPCAHSPASVENLCNLRHVIDPRAAAEVASGTGLPCILQGFTQLGAVVTKGGIGVHDLCAIIVPFDCAGGIPALAASTYDIPLVAVRGNKCRLGVPADQLALSRMFVVDNYAEAIGVVACLKAGVCVQSIGRPLRAIQRLE